MEKIIFERLLPYLRHWNTKIGLGVIEILLVLILHSILPNTLPINDKLLIFIGSIFILYLIWFVKSGRVIIPSSKKTVVFCFDVDDEANKNYSRVISRVKNSINDLGINNRIRVISIAKDLISDKKKAHRYRSKHNVDLIIWGHAEYGNLSSQKVLRFEINHTMVISESLSEKLNQFLADVSLILSRKNWIIREVNELQEFKVISNNLFETMLFIIGIYFYDEKHFIESITIFECLLPFVIEKEKNKEFIEYQIQAARIRTLIAEQYFIYGRQLHDEGKMKESLNYFIKIPEHLTKPIPLFIMLARTYYLLGDLKNANKYTEEIRRINKRHPAVCLNIAFFAIRAKNFDRVKFWYDELMKHKELNDIDIFSVITFLDEEYNKDQSEIAYLYALGIVNGYIDPRKRKSELRKFMRKAKKRTEYSTLYQRANELV